MEGTQASNGKVHVRSNKDSELIKSSQAMESTQASNGKVHVRSNKDSELITIAFFFTLTLSSLDAHLFVVFLQCSKILTSFRKFAFLHSFANIPMHECPLGVHEVEFVVNAREHLGDCSGVADHAASPHYLCQVTSWHHSWRLIIDTTLEACRTPIDELDRALCLNRSNRCVDILGNNVTAIHHATRHIFPMSWVAFDEH